MRTSTMRAPEIGEHPQRLLERRRVAAVDALQGVAPIDSDPQALHAFVKATRGIRGRFRQRRRIVRVVPRDRVEDDRDVGHAASHGPDVIERLRQG
jgi:hypothetical protein